LAQTAPKQDEFVPSSNPLAPTTKVSPDSTTPAEMKNKTVSSTYQNTSLEQLVAWDTKTISKANGADVLVRQAVTLPRYETQPSVPGQKPVPSSGLTVTIDGKNVIAKWEVPQGSYSKIYTLSGIYNEATKSATLSRMDLGQKREWILQFSGEGEQLALSTFTENYSRNQTKMVFNREGLLQDKFTSQSISNLIGYYTQRREVNQVDHYEYGSAETKTKLHFEETVTYRQYQWPNPEYVYDYSSSGSYNRFDQGNSQIFTAYGNSRTRGLYAQIKDAVQSGKDATVFIDAVSTSKTYQTYDGDMTLANEKLRIFFKRSSTTQPWSLDQVVNVKTNTIYYSAKPPVIFSKDGTNYIRIEKNPALSPKEKYLLSLDTATSAIKMIPLQDVPAGQVTYEVAEIKNGVYCVMSAGGTQQYLSDPTSNFELNQKVYAGIAIDGAKFWISRSLIDGKSTLIKCSSVQADGATYSVARLDSGIYCVTDSANTRYMSDADQVVQIGQRQYKIKADAQNNLFFERIPQVVFKTSVDMNPPMQTALRDDGTYQVDYNGQTYMSDPKGVVSINGLAMTFEFDTNKDGMVSVMDQPNISYTIVLGGTTYRERVLMRIRSEALLQIVGMDRKTEPDGAYKTLIDTVNYAEGSMIARYDGGVYEKMISYQNGRDGFKIGMDTYGIHLQMTPQPFLSLNYSGTGVLRSIRTDGNLHLSVLQKGGAFDIAGRDWTNDAVRNLALLQSLLIDDALVDNSVAVYPSDDSSFVFGSMGMDVDHLIVNVKMNGVILGNFNTQTASDGSLSLTFPLPDGVDQTFRIEIDNQNIPVFYKVDNTPARLQKAALAFYGGSFPAGATVTTGPEGNQFFVKIEVAGKPTEKLYFSKDADGKLTLNSMRQRLEEKSNGYYKDLIIQFDNVTAGRQITRKILKHNSNNTETESDIYRVAIGSESPSREMIHVVENSYAFTGEATYEAVRTSIGRWKVTVTVDMTTTARPFTKHELVYKASSSWANIQTARDFVGTKWVREGNYSLLGVVVVSIPNPKPLPGMEMIEIGRTQFDTKTDGVHWGHQELVGQAYDFFGNKFPTGVKLKTNVLSPLALWRGPSLQVENLTVNNQVRTANISFRRNNFGDVSISMVENVMPDPKEYIYVRPGGPGINFIDIGGGASGVTTTVQMSVPANQIVNPKLSMAQSITKLRQYFAGKNIATPATMKLISEYVPGRWMFEFNPDPEKPLSGKSIRYMVKPDPNGYVERDTIVSGNV
jgi:hypothetical protein